VQASGAGTSAALFYLAAYSFMVIGSFGVVALVGRTGDGRHTLADYAGLARTRPLLALAFTVFLLAQAGTPFTAGFFAKFGVIQAAADTQNWSLAVIAMVSAVISAFVYLRIVVTMFFAADDEIDPTASAIRVPRAAAAALVLAVMGTLAMGLVPQPFRKLADDATPVLVADGR